MPVTAGTQGLGAKRAAGVRARGHRRVDRIDSRHVDSAAASVACPRLPTAEPVDDTPPSSVGRSDDAAPPGSTAPLDSRPATGTSHGSPTARRAQQRRCAADGDPATGTSAPHQPRDARSTRRTARRRSACMKHPAHQPRGDAAQLDGHRPARAGTNAGHLPEQPDDYPLCLAWDTVRAQGRRHPSRAPSAPQDADTRAKLRHREVADHPAVLPARPPHPPGRPDASHDTLG